MIARTRLPSARRLPVIRVFYVHGSRRMLQVACLQWFVMASLGVILVLMPNLQNPSLIATDAWNYWSAGSRLNAGLSIYAYQPGMEQLADNWAYALLSPPPLAVLWRVLALLPAASSMYLWWLLGAASSGAFVLWLIARSHKFGLFLLLLLITPEAFNMWFGNVSPLLIPALGLAWASHVRGRDSLAGALVGVAAVLKLMPALFAWWFIVRRDWRGLLACLIAIAVGLGFGVLGAGWQSYSQYIDVIRYASSSRLDPFSPILIVHRLGGPDALALATPYLIAGLAVLSAYLLRKRPDWAFAVLAVGVTLGTPNLRFDSLAWLLVALAPFADAPWRPVNVRDWIGGLVHYPRASRIPFA